MKNKIYIITGEAQYEISPPILAIQARSKVSALKKLGATESSEQEYGFSNPILHIPKERIIKMEKAIGKKINRDAFCLHEIPLVNTL